jgi:hypothetical protein
MRKTIFPVILVLLALQLPAGQTAFKPGTGKLYLPKVNTIFYKLGDRVIQLKTFQYGDVKDMVYINLHDDEITAVNGARKVLEKKGGYLIKIENYRTRNIKFKLEGKYYTVDPNRMFSRAGIAQSLILFGNTSSKAINEIEKFANRILQLVPQNLSCIIALHNNSNGKYSINSYLPGGAREKDAKTIHVNPELDADDFFLTTDSILFNRLAGEKYNTIWQDNEKAKKDGSLSIYCGEKKIQYVNCETEHGRQPEYDEMIGVAVNKAEGNNSEVTVGIANKTEAKKSNVIVAANMIETKTPEITVNKNNPDMIAYNYRIIPTNGHISPKTNTEILFGDKKVGFVRSVLTDSSWTIAGKLEMNKDFSLYSNMDFFFFLSSTNPPRLEVRIDPTRMKELINPEAVISIRTKTGY